MNADNGTARVDHPTNDDEAVYILPYTEDIAQQSALTGISKRTDPEPDASTPDPVTGEEEDGGVVTRANEFLASLGPTMLEAVGLHGMEIAKANGRRASELYRNTFPLVTPRFAAKCVDCGAAYEAESETCEACGGETRPPDPKQRTDAKQFFARVNREGQSLRELYESLARDGGRLGVWTHIVSKRYHYWDRPAVRFGDDTLLEPGDVVSEPIELVRADPKRLKPVANEKGRVGGWWWACPVCDDRVETMTREPGTCDEHGVDLREVFFAETEGPGQHDPETVYFDDEVITYAGFEPRLAGLDGLSPLDSLWLKQAILKWMDLYAGAFFDTEGTNRFPNKLLIVHTSNKRTLEKQLSQAQDEADEDPYAQGVLYNEIDPARDGSGDSAQVIDMMSDTLLGQSDQLKTDYKSDIRSRFGLVDAQDSELDDAGGLNNEGLQLEINDRDKAKTQQDLMEGPLRKLMDSLGFDDYEIRFVPPEREEETPSTLETVRAAALARERGVPHEIENGRVEVLDSDGPVETTPADTSDGGGMDPDPSDAASTPSLTDDNLSQQADATAAAMTEAELRYLEAIQQALCWPDPETLLADAPDAADVDQQSASPFITADEDMPEFVKDLIEQALRNGSVYLGEYEADNVTGQAVKQFFEEKLDQPQGWSMRSLSRDFADRFDIDVEDAVRTLQTQLTSVLGEGREQGYRQQGDLDERVFKWVGPADDAKTDACWELLRETNPKYGGTPRPLDELKALVAEKREQHFPAFGGSEWVVHWNERDTYVEHFE